MTDEVKGKQPRVSVLAPFYNSAKYLPEMIESVLSQSYADFELILCDDCSTDNSVEVVESFKDPRIRLIRNEVNMRSAASRNRLIEEAKGEYCVMFDSDDTFLPGRLQKQVDFLDTHPEIDYCSGIIVFIDEQGQNQHRYNYNKKEKHDEIKVLSLFGCPCGHTTAMFRLDKYKRHNIFYDPKLNYADDFNMISQALEVMRFENILEPICTYRQHQGQMSDITFDKQTNDAVEVLAKTHSKLGIEISGRDKEIIRDLLLWNTPDKDIKHCSNYLVRLIKANNSIGKYNKAELKKQALYIFRRSYKKGRKGLRWFKNYPEYLKLKLRLVRY